MNGLAIKKEEQRAPAGRKVETTAGGTGQIETETKHNRSQMHRRHHLLHQKPKSVKTLNLLRKGRQLPGRRL